MSTMAKYIYIYMYVAYLKRIVPTTAKPMRESVRVRVRVRVRVTKHT
jgi:hypothetical protein